jgi:hypothetical protein
MKRSIGENIEGAIRDEFSLQDTYRMLMREHAMDGVEAASYLRSEYIKKSFDLYRDKTIDDRTIFERAQMSEISDFESKLARFTYLTRHK